MKISVGDIQILVGYHPQTELGHAGLSSAFQTYPQEWSKCGVASETQPLKPEKQGSSPAWDEAPWWRRASGTQTVPGSRLQPDFLPPLTSAKCLPLVGMEAFWSLDICSIFPGKVHNILLFVLTLGCILNEKTQFFFFLRFCPPHPL